MQTVTDALALRGMVDEWRRAGLRVGFVPTMGNLHAGHYSLLDVARERADRVIASVFVNPTQFGPNEDFARYPRTLESDQSGLRERGCDLLFVPSVDAIYPYGVADTVRIEVPGLSDVLEGAARPGHFVGVATVVTKLFNWVTPHIAVFGQKDYQQLLVIRRLVSDLGIPVEIASAKTAREDNGLARSSRNQYLQAAERDRAAVIYRTLRSMRDQVLAGPADFAAIEVQACEGLIAAGLTPDYAVIRRAEDLATPAGGEPGRLIALIAARSGKTRLIDNLLLAI
jgi:pantoate--beta-alanine ligase